MRKQKSFLRDNRWIVAMVFGIIGVGFLPIGILGGILPRYGMTAWVNGVYRQLTMNEVWMFRGIFGGTFGLIGFVFLIVALILLKRGSKRRKEIELLKREGMMVVADVTGCQSAETRFTTTVNGRHQIDYELTCSYTDVMGQTYIFTSDKLHKDPTPFLEDGKVNVYCDRTNMKPYFVDIDGSIGLGNRVIEL